MANETNQTRLPRRVNFPERNQECPDSPHGKFVRLVRQVADSAKPNLVNYISTGTEDRHGTTFAPNGWRLDAFERVGAVTFNHMFNGQEIGILPIGRNEDLETDSFGLIANTRFAVDMPPPVGPWARLLLELYREGYGRGWSVTFDPFAWVVRSTGKKEARKRGEPWFDLPGRDYNDQELVEYGPVVIASNTNVGPAPTKEAIGAIERGYRSLQTDGIDVPPSLFTELEIARLLNDSPKPERTLNPDNLQEDQLEAIFAANVEWFTRRIVSLAGIQARKSNAAVGFRTKTAQRALARLKGAANQLGRTVANGRSE